MHDTADKAQARKCFSNYLYLVVQENYNEQFEVFAGFNNLKDAVEFITSHHRHQSDVHIIRSIKWRSEYSELEANSLMNTLAKSVDYGAEKPMRDNEDGTTSLMDKFFPKENKRDQAAREHMQSREF